MDYFNKLLPVDITVDILARLPTESVLDSKLVCTRWRNVVSNQPSFSKIHLHHHLNNPSSVADPQEYCKLGFFAVILRNTESFYYFEYNEKNHDDDDEEEEEESRKSIQSIKRIKFTSPFRMNTLVGSCNGLVCVLSDRGHPDLRVCIFNPITREYVLLPVIETEFRFHVGFGYVSSTNEYKVLIMKGVSGYVSSTNFDLHIYTLGSRSGWRKLIENFDFECEYLNKRGILVKEVLYWMDVKSKRIVAFDLVEENFFLCEHLPPPPLPPRNSWSSMGVLNGVLFFALGSGQQFFALSNRQEEIDIWLLKKKKPNHEKEEAEEHQSMCWRKEFRIDTMELLSITKSGGVFTYNGNYLKIYNTKTLISKSLVKFENWIHQVIPHENTLVSLKELGEEDTKVMEAAEETENRDQLREDTDREYIHL